MGLDSREVTPELTRAVIHLAAEIRSFGRTELAVEKVLGVKVSDSTVRRLAKQVGQELAELEQTVDRTNDKEVVVPELAVVSCDGGRIRTREPGCGRGVHLSGDNGWRETKNASFERMTRNAPPADGDDPCIALPTSFRTTKKVANIAEKAVPDVDEPMNAVASRVRYEGPTRILRTAVSSMACSDEFGPMMKREAQRRRFFEAHLRAFLGDGLNWNWSIWKCHFSTFIPILDFIHAIQYVFSAAMAIHANETQAWATYVELITWCWQGQVTRVIAELASVCRDRGIHPNDPVADDALHQPILDAIRYLTNNQSRMDYPRYRRLGLPVTSAPMESLIKQMNTRVKGTEMFWDDPDGAEAILQIRAAAISDDGRLDGYLTKRPGWQFQRRTSEPRIAA
ncbi:MAG: hypothetical protein U0236_23700 [Nitrospira sp.]